MMAWRAPASRSEALAQVGDIFPDSIEDQGRVCRALARLPDDEVVNLFAAPTKGLVEATLRALLAESTGKLSLGRGSRAEGAGQILLAAISTAKAGPDGAADR
jgi:hypothetical protein